MPPSAGVLAAFGVEVTTAPVLLPGGQGTTWLVGNRVLKPVGDEPWAEKEADWLGSLLDALPENGFRVSRPIRPIRPVRGRREIRVPSTWTVDGWSAGTWVEGEHHPPAGVAEDQRSADVIAAGRVFHAALVGVPRPDFLDRRDDPWSRGDGAAWDDAAPCAIHRELQQALDELSLLRSPNTAPMQLVHGDLTANVLFAGGQDPAIIDLSPYWRPVSFAEAVVVADAIAWHGAGREVLYLLPRDVDRASLVARALIFRLITSDLVAADLGLRRSAYLQENVVAADRVLTVLRDAHRHI